MLAAVIIPVYKENLTEEEKVSLLQVCKILYQHPIIIVCPYGINLQNYFEFFSKFQVEYFSSNYFKNIQGYNKLMISKEFYKRFIKYHYILIYQLDAFVFRDELALWCNKGFDFIGAPWLENFKSGNQIQEFAGNGGFSLRNVKKSIKVLTGFKLYLSPKVLIKLYYNKNSFLKFILKSPIIILKIFGFKNSFKYFSSKIYKENEDLFWVYIVPKYFNWFKLAKSEEAISFSFEYDPSRMFNLNKNNLPFGCHAWKKYDYDFWKPFIIGNIGSASNID